MDLNCFFVSYLPWLVCLCSSSSPLLSCPLVTFHICFVVFRNHHWLDVIFHQIKWVLFTHCFMHNHFGNIQLLQILFVKFNLRGTDFLVSATNWTVLLLPCFQKLMFAMYWSCFWLRCRWTSVSAGVTSKPCAEKQSTGSTNLNDSSVPIHLFLKVVTLFYK